jgi:hypothetical protein
MHPASRHQCLLYGGPPSRQLPALAAATLLKLNQNYRCLYLNSSPMVAGFRSYISAIGVDVQYELTKGSLVLESQQSHLREGRFDVDKMIGTLEGAVRKALADGYAGLFATGDMSWEFGQDKDFSKLVEYEVRLEETFGKCPQLSGICQYHSDTLPREALHFGLESHGALFVNATLARINPHYVPQPSFRYTPARPNAALDNFMFQWLNESSIN